MNVDNLEAPVKRGKREQTKVNNRKAILAAARSIFAELGYGTTTVRDIIRRTDLASGTFYNYFQSKEEVFQALMDTNALEVRPQLIEVRANATTFEDLIEGTFRIFFDYLARGIVKVEGVQAEAGRQRLQRAPVEGLFSTAVLRQQVKAKTFQHRVAVQEELKTHGVLGLGV